MRHRFDGSNYDPALDQKRLATQLNRVYFCMIDGQWRTLAEIESRTKDPQASISAQLRNLRKERFGSYIINRRRRENAGTFEYQLKAGVFEQGELF